MIPEITFFRSVHSLKDCPSTGLPEICISGRSNVGKSSVINRLANRRKLAKISQTPGKTQSLNYYQAGTAYYLVDLPGYGYAKISKSRRQEFATLIEPYLNERQELVGIIQLFDARHGPIAGDYEMLEWLRTWGRNILYVFTKADKLSANARKILIKTYKKECGVDSIVMLSAITGMGLHELRSWISKTLTINKISTGMDK
ncbi:ribosome biogenesis GTP-binding protein YihA/YsxC [Candidatus Latescibacterota bacterium]